MRPVHPDFQQWLQHKNQPLIDLFLDARTFILELYPEANEFVYHTHALTAVFTPSDKISDAFCMLPIYTNHLNLAFSAGARLKDPHNLLSGTGKTMRHLDVQKPEDYRNEEVKAIILDAIAFSLKFMDKPGTFKGMTVSKIKNG